MHTSDMIKVMQAFLEGEHIKVTSRHADDYTAVFSILTRPDMEWNWAIYDYGIYKESYTIDWDHVHVDYIYMATDKDGRTYLYTHEPVISEVYGHWAPTSLIDWEMDRADVFSSFKKGGVFWKDSLVVRP